MTALLASYTASSRCTMCPMIPAIPSFCSCCLVPSAIPTAAMTSLSFRFAPHHAVWSTGQDQMRIVKQRLVEMVPELAVFLDVDDMEDISQLEGYVDRSQVILIFCSRGYFESKNCCRELTSAVMKGKRLIALLESEVKHGGMGVAEVRAELQAMEARYDTWGMPWSTPKADEIAEALLSQPVVEWTRIGVFQDVSMRILAERVLGITGTYLEGEIGASVMTLRAPLRQLPHLQPQKGAARQATMRALDKMGAARKSNSSKGPGLCHLYCSPHNLGAEELVAEANAALGIHISTSSHFGQIGRCERMLLLLHSETFSGAAGRRFLGEVQQAMSQRVQLLLGHEMLSVSPEDSAGRRACGTGERIERMCACAYVRTCVRAYVCARVYVCACVHVCMFACLHMCMCTCVYVCICACGSNTSILIRVCHQFAPPPHPRRICRLLSGRASGATSAGHLQLTGSSTQGRRVAWRRPEATRHGGLQGATCPRQPPQRECDEASQFEAPREKGRAPGPQRPSAGRARRRRTGTCGA